MALISVTRVRLRSPRYLPAFMWYTFLSYWQARRTQGNVSVELLADANSGYWTRSVWRDEAAMRQFMQSGAHKKAMPRLLDWCDEAHVVHWSQESAEAPSWQEGHRRMIAGGRKSKVRRPSPRHDAMDIPAPKE